MTDDVLKLMELVGTLTIENLDFRKFLWMSHGHEGLYGDDGEMQCSICRIDYKRDSLKMITDAWQKTMKPDDEIERLKFTILTLEKMLKHNSPDASLAQAMLNIIERTNEGKMISWQA